MAYDSAGLNAAGAQSKAGNAPALWTYTTTDSAATVDTTGYFNGASSLLNIGDIIFRVTTSSGAVSTAGMHVVVSNASGVVDVTDTTAMTVTDTD
jgi:hypothetical protein